MKARGARIVVSNARVCLYPGRGHRLDRAPFTVTQRAARSGGEGSFPQSIEACSDSSPSLQVDPSSHFKRNDTTALGGNGGGLSYSR